MGHMPLASIPFPQMTLADASEVTVSSSGSAADSAPDLNTHLPRWEAKLYLGSPET